MKDIWYLIVYTQPYMYFLAKLIGGDIGKAADQAISDLMQAVSLLIILAIFAYLICQSLGLLT